jgi:two-component system response regulator VicR
VCEYDGLAALERLRESHFDLLILDVMLPSLDAFSLLKKLREFSDIPVIILSARAEEEDKLTGLSLMADDYMTKPFSVKELIARVKVNLARAEGKHTVSQTYSAGDITLDSSTLEVTKNGEVIPLSVKEAKILLLLFKNRTKVLSREEILEQVWGYNGYLGDTHTVDVAIGRLRAKLGNSEIIHSRRGAGYDI